MQLADQQFYNCIATADDGTEYFLDANWIHNNDLDHWQGWNCSAGLLRISIENDGNVYGGQCLNDHLGHVDTGWELLQEPATCKRERCIGCTDDLTVKKEINVV